MRNIKTIVFKEFARFFKDPRLVITTLLLPGLMIFTLYSVMGPALNASIVGDEDYVANAYVVNYPETITAALEASGLKIDFTEITEAEIESVKQEITDKDIDLLIIFPADFEESVPLYDPLSGLPAPLVEIFFNSAKNESINVYNKFAFALDIYESSMANRFDVNFSGTNYDLADQKDIMGSMFAMILPFLIITFLFSGCMALAPESIAGEKERGTIATLLITPIKRGELAIGKILSLSCLATLGAMSSFLGTMLSLPKMMQGAMGDASSNVYNLLDYSGLLLVIISTVLVLITMVSIISAFAKTVKEAAALIMPLMIVIFTVGITSMFSPAGDNPLMYIIPVYNSVHVMSQIFSFGFNTTNFMVTIISNLAWTTILVYLLTKMFNSEKIMFSK